MPDGDAGGSILLNLRGAVRQTRCICSGTAWWAAKVESGSLRPAELGDRGKFGHGAARHCRKRIAMAAKMTESTWVLESFDDAKRYVYVGPAGHGDRAAHLTPEYFATAKKVGRATGELWQAQGWRLC